MHLTSRVALKILVDQNLGGDGRWRKKHEAGLNMQT